MISFDSCRSNFGPILRCHSADSFFFPILRPPLFDKTRKPFSPSWSLYCPPFIATTRRAQAASSQSIPPHNVLLPLPFRPNRSFTSWFLPLLFTHPWSQRQRALPFPSSPSLVSFPHAPQRHRLKGRLFILLPPSLTQPPFWRATGQREVETAPTTGVQYGLRVLAPRTDLGF